MKKKFLYFFQIFFTFIFFSILSNYSLAANITGDNTISSDSSTQQTFNAADTSLTITDSSTLDRDTGQKPININEQDNGTVTIHFGSSAVGTANTVAGNDTTGLTVNNSGTITSTGAKAINLLDSTDASIVNNSGGIINSKTNAISISKNGTTPDNITITNSGTIYTTNGSTNTIVFHSSSTDSTVTNNSGGHIYNTSTSAVIVIGKDSTLTNSGKIENKQAPDEQSIKLQGSGNTITLKDGGIVIGTIKNSSSNTNTLKIQHGVGQGYFYETSGSGTFNLEDLDGNQIVQGSAGSVGQGGNETRDELLGYKTHNIRKSLNRYKRNKNNLDETKGWGETFGSYIKRDQNNQNLALSYEFLNLGVNIINPLQNSDFIISFETSRQDFTKDHSINHIGMLSGFNFYNLHSETFILGGVTLHNSERTILTNTTTTGTLDIDDTYFSLKAMTGSELNNIKLIPDVGFTAGYEITPSHNESKYYSWGTKSILNLSAYLEDEYSFQIINENNNLNLGWTIDYRKLIFGKEQDYKINNTSATYSQTDDLTQELTFLINLGFDKKISNLGAFAFALDGFYSTQETSGLKGSINYIMEL